jgi:hypothetical protein
MAKTKVLTITIQNQPGALAAIAKALGSAKVNILAVSLGSVVNFTVFVGNCPKSGVRRHNVCSSRSIFTNVALTLQGF